MPDTGPVVAKTPPGAWLRSLVFHKGLEIATTDSFADARRLELSNAEGDDAQLVGRSPFPGVEQVWLRLAVRGRRHPWRSGWIAEISSDGEAEADVALLSPDHPIACLSTTSTGAGSLRVRPLAMSRTARAKPLPMCEAVPLRDVAFGRRTRQSSAASAVNPFTAMFKWMTPTAAEPRPWWELDTGAAHYVERILIYSNAPIPGLARVYLFSDFMPDGSLAAPFMTTLELDASPVSFEVGEVGRHVRIELEAADGQEIVLGLGAVEILAAPLTQGSLLDNLCRSFTLFADRPLFAHREHSGGQLGGYERWTSYREAWAQAAGLASGLAEFMAGSEHERIVVGICASARAQWLIADIACTQRGYVVVPLAPTDRPDIWRHVIDSCGVHALLCGPGLVASFIELGAVCPSLELIVEMAPVHDERPAEVNDKNAARRVTHRSFADVEQRGEASTSWSLVQRDGGELSAVLYTSGTTGQPKGAMRSYDAFSAMVAGYGVVQPAVYLSYQPLSHLSERMMIPTLIRSGGRIGFASGEPVRLFEDIAALQPTALGGVPRVFDTLRAQYHQAVIERRRDHPDAAPGEIEAAVLSSLRAIFGPKLQAVWVGSAKSSPALLEFMRELFTGCWMVEGYGITEVGTIAHDGVVLPNVDVKLIDVPELGYRTSDEPPRGEICVRTPHMISGYLGDERASAERFDADGYFRTGDIGQRDADNEIQVIGRRENVVKLAQGEFVAPERIEAILRRCPLVDQIHVHANPLAACVVAIVVPNLVILRAQAKQPVPEGFATSEAARALVSGALRAVAQREMLAAHEIPRAVHLELEPMTVEAGLLTSSNKQNRRAIEQRYRPVLEQLEQLEQRASGGQGPSLLGVVEHVARAVIGDVPLDAELGAGLGVDSLAGVQLVAMLQARLDREVPLDAWFAASSLEDFARRLSGAPPRAGTHEQAHADLALEQPFTRAGIAACPLAEHWRDDRHVLLTGATGFLGRGLLEVLMTDTSAHVTCLVRADTVAAGEQRLRAHLAAGGVTWSDAWSARVTVMPGDLSEPCVGLDAQHWAELAESVDVIIHAAAVVNWIMRYAQLRAPNVLGTIELMRLAASERLKAFHFVSTISAAPIAGDEDTTLTEAQALASSGYGLSKWIAERHVHRAAELGLPVAIYRPGMIAGHSTRGHANAGDFGTRYMAGSAQLGLYLDLDEVLEMIPVDFVSRAIVALSGRAGALGRTHHLVNIERSPSYRALGQTMRQAGVDVRPASYAGFRDALLRDADGRNPLLPLLSYFPAAGFALRMGPWPSARTSEELHALGLRCPPVDDAMIAAYLRAAQRMCGARLSLE